MLLTHIYIVSLAVYLEHGFDTRKLGLFYVTFGDVFMLRLVLGMVLR